MKFLEQNYFNCSHLAKLDFYWQPAVEKPTEWTNGSHAWTQLLTMQD